MIRIRKSGAPLILAFLVACTGNGGGEGGGGEALLEAPGVDGVVALTGPPEEGGGKIPTFEWEPVDGASFYRLAVLGSDGQGIWAWEGPETSMILGGVPGRPEGDAGPIITPGSSWSVVALDGAGKVIAVSVVRSVSP